MAGIDAEQLASRVRERAGQSVALLLAGVAVALIPFAGTLLVLFVGWIPLLMWLMRGVDPFFDAMQLHRNDLLALAGFSVAAPIAVYGFHLWIVMQGP